VLCALGDWTQGWVLYLDDGHLAACINIAGEESSAVSETLVADGVTALGFRIAVRDRGGFDLELVADDEVVGRGNGDRPIPVGMQQVGGTGLCIGYDRGFPVTDRYATPHRFTGTIRYVTIDVPEPSTVERVAAIAQALHED
jgi:arylsulfatase